MTRARAPGGRRILGAAVIAHVALVATLAAGGLRPVFNDIRNRPGPAADFFAVYHAGRQVWTGRNPYDMEERPRITPPYFAPYRYPPGAAFTIGAAVARFRPWVAYAMWLLVLEGLLLACVRRLGVLVGDPRLRAWAQAGLLAFPPFCLELWMGQFTWFAAALVFLAVAAWRRGKPRAGAAAWAVACAVKIFPLALVPALARRRRWGALATAAAALGLAIAWFAWHPADGRGFFRLNFGAPEVAEIHAGNFGLHAFLYELVAWLGGAPDPAGWAQVSRAVSIALALGAAVAMLAGPSSDERLGAAMTLWLLPLVSKDAWEHHYVIAPAAAALMVSVVEAWPDRRRWLGAIAAVWTVCALPSLLVVLQHGPPDWYPDAAWSPAARVAYHAPRPIAALAGLALCVLAAARRPERSAPPRGT